MEIKNKKGQLIRTIKAESFEGIDLRDADLRDADLRGMNLQIYEHKKGDEV